MDRPKCDECNLYDGIWFDDDGVIRCQECHTKVSTAWGGDYDELVKRRTFQVVQYVPLPVAKL